MLEVIENIKYWIGESYEKRAFRIKNDKLDWEYSKREIDKSHAKERYLFWIV